MKGQRSARAQLLRELPRRLIFLFISSHMRIQKLLEIWFAPSVEALGEQAGPSRDAGLRVVPRRVWEDMLDLVRCKVLSVIEGEEVDAYLLR